MATQKTALRLEFEAQREVDFTDLSADYIAIGTAMVFPSRVIKLTNATNALLQFSKDGDTDHFVLLPMSDFIFDICANKTRDDGFYLGQNVTIYVKEIGSATSGAVYLSTIYGVD